LHAMDVLHTYVHTIHSVNAPFLKKIHTYVRCNFVIVYVHYSPVPFTKY